MNAQPNTAPPPVSAGVIPCLSVSDANAAAVFYAKAFAGEVLNKIPADDGKRLIHCHMRINGGSFIFNDCFPEYGHPLKDHQGYVLHLQVDDVDAVWKRAVDAGCTVAMPLERQFWGDRYGQVVDPFGVRWAMGSAA